MKEGIPGKVARVKVIFAFEMLSMVKAYIIPESSEVGRTCHIDIKSKKIE